MILGINLRDCYGLFYCLTGLFKIFTYCGDANILLSILFLHMYHHAMATFIIYDVGDSLAYGYPFSLWLW